MTHINRKKLTAGVEPEKVPVSFRSMRPTAKDIAKGARLGFFFAIGFSIIALLIYGAEGSQPFQRNQTSFGVVLVLYFFGFTAAGVIAGAFHRLASRYAVLGYVIGIIAAIPMSFATTSVVRQTFFLWSTNDWLTAWVCSVIFGIIGARMFRKDPIKWD